MRDPLFKKHCSRHKKMLNFLFRDQFSLQQKMSVEQPIDLITRQVLPIIISPQFSTFQEDLGQWPMASRSHTATDAVKLYPACFVSFQDTTA
jgi:hypothetical protein